MSLYAAYGTNMDPARMRRHAPHSPLVGTAWLDGWRLTFAGEDLGWEGALATVVEDSSARTFVALYDVPDSDQPLLDQWEGGDLIATKKIHTRIEQARLTASPQRIAALEEYVDDAPGPVITTPIMAWFYAVEAYEGGIPSHYYLQMLADAAEAAGAPLSYVESIRQRPCTGLHH